MSKHTTADHSADTPAWWETPVQTRSERFASSDPTEFPTPSVRQPEWRYSPIDALRPLIDGELDGGRYDITVDGAELHWAPLADVAGRAGLPEDLLAARAWSATTDAAHIIVGGSGEGVTIRRAIDGVRAAHLVVEFEPNTHRHVVIENHGAGALTENVEFIVGENATAYVYHLGEWDNQAIHAASHFATVARGGDLTHILVSLSGAVQRVNPSFALVGDRAAVEASGVYFADNGRHVEHQVFVHHQGPNTQSNVLYKGALHGQSTHTVWIGDVLIGREAVGTDSYEANRNLVLSDGARADSVPNLEIETGDIAGAGHASATGRLDDEHLFYLQARGISEVEARRLVALGFLLEIVGRINVPEVEARLTEKLAAALDAVEEN
jgi:Fe-S cluster assembly protein SufD